MLKSKLLDLEKPQDYVEIFMIYMISTASLGWKDNIRWFRR